MEVHKILQDPVGRLCRTSKSYTKILQDFIVLQRSPQHPTGSCRILRIPLQSYRTFSLGIVHSMAGIGWQCVVHCGEEQLKNSWKLHQQNSVSDRWVDRITRHWAVNTLHGGSMTLNHQIIQNRAPHTRAAFTQSNPRSTETA